jgi:hypothetical protein
MESYQTTRVRYLQLQYKGTEAREREREESVWIVETLYLTGGSRAKFTAIKVPRQ